MEELTEVITAAEFHPLHCNLFVYSSSKGTIRLCDMRERALCDHQAMRMFLDLLFIQFCFTEFEEPEDPSSRSFFSEIISSISDVKFSHAGDHLLTRDYLGVKVCSLYLNIFILLLLQVWDLRKSNEPMETYQVHEYLRTKLCSLYENDCIFDKFECAWSGDDK